MRLYGQCVLLIVALAPFAAADEAHEFAVKYLQHYQSDDIPWYGQGKLIVTVPSPAGPSGSSAHIKLEMHANPDANVGEWGMSNKSVYELAYQNGAGWQFAPGSPKNKPDHFTPNDGNKGAFDVEFVVPLASTNGAELSSQLELYVSCHRCNPASNVPPPADHANCRIVVTLTWKTDSTGAFQYCRPDRFAVDQCSGLGTSSAYYPAKQIGVAKVSNGAIACCRGPAQCGSINASSSCYMANCSSGSSCGSCVEARRCRRVCRCH